MNLFQFKVAQNAVGERILLKKKQVDGEFLVHVHGRSLLTINWRKDNIVDKGELLPYDIWCYIQNLCLIVKSQL